MTDTMNNLTPRAQQTLAMARSEADRLKHSFVGTEHILLGILKLAKGVAFGVLQKLGLELDVVRLAVEREAGTGPAQKLMGPLPFTPRSKKVFALAKMESDELHHTYVGTEHILLGLLREGEGVAARVLKTLGVELEIARLEVLRELDPNNVLDPAPALPIPQSVTSAGSDDLVALNAYIELLWPAIARIDEGVRVTILRVIFVPIIQSHDRDLLGRFFDIPMALEWVRIIATLLDSESQKVIQQIFNESRVDTPRYNSTCAVLELSTGEVPSQIVPATSTLAKFGS